jgi:hypothetical protein
MSNNQRFNEDYLTVTAALSSSVCVIAFRAAEYFEKKNKKQMLYYISL